MTDILIHKAGNHQVTCVPNAFIDEYMQEANGEFVKIYLYLLRMLCQDGGHFSIASMADTFNYTENDVRRGLSYWEKMHLLHLEYDQAGNLTGICLLEPQGVSQVTVSPASVGISQPPRQPSTASPAKPETVPVNSAPTRQVAQYTPQEILVFQEQDSIQELVMVSERYIGHPLSMTDMNTILYWYDGLGFSTELIEFLVEYCVEKGHGSIYYMNRVALDWKDKGIATVEEAKQTANIHSQSYYAVMKAFGISGRNLVSNEIAYIEKWTNLYGFTLDIINEACSRTIQNTGKASFKYADKILSDWHNQGIQHLDDVSTLDKQASPKNTSRPKAGTAKVNNRFHNFEQRQYDEDFYDTLEQQLLRK